MTRSRPPRIAAPFYCGIAAGAAGVSIAVLPAASVPPGSEARPITVTQSRPHSFGPGMRGRVLAQGFAVQSCLEAVQSFGAPRLVAVLAYPPGVSRRAVQAVEFGFLLRLFLVACDFQVIEVPLSALYHFAGPRIVPSAGGSAAGPAPRLAAPPTGALSRAVLLAIAARAFDGRPHAAATGRPPRTPTADPA